MFPCMLLCTSRSDKTRKKGGDSPQTSSGRQKSKSPTSARREVNIDASSQAGCDIEPVSPNTARFPFPVANLNWGREAKELRNKRSGDMVSKGSNFSDLIHRAASSCLLHPLSSGRGASEFLGDSDGWESLAADERENGVVVGEEEEDEHEQSHGGRIRPSNSKNWCRAESMEILLVEVFDIVAAMKRAYARLQEAHCPWDPERMRVADSMILGEFRKLAVLRDRLKGGRKIAWKESCFCGGGGVGALMREVVAPYEATIEELRRDMKAKETEMEILKERVTRSNGGSSDAVKRSARGGHASRRKVGCSSLGYNAPGPELFESVMGRVYEASKTFTSLLLTLMRSAHWDIAAAVRSIEAATPSIDEPSSTTSGAAMIASTIASHHAKYALESYISRKVFLGFDHESFYMDGSLSSLLNPDQFRRECFTQYQDMKSMEPSELLGILPSCQFGRFCCKKYLAIVHPKMEESLFGNLEQRQAVVGGGHPRSQFYGNFLELAKAVWLLHLVAFSLDPPPSQFEASRGAEFHPQYMDSVIKFSGGRVPAGQIVGFPVNPGFKLGNGGVVKARVYLVSRT